MRHELNSVPGRLAPVPPCSPGPPTKDCASSLNSAQEERLNNGLPAASPKRGKRSPADLEPVCTGRSRTKRVSPDAEIARPSTPAKPAKLPRAASFCAGAPDIKPAPSLKEALSHVSAAVANNSEPCIQGQWQWEAGCVRSFNPISGNKIAIDAGEQIDIDNLAAKLTTPTSSARPGNQPLTQEELRCKSIALTSVSLVCLASVVR